MCTCSATTRQCPACLAWEQHQLFEQKKGRRQRGLLIQDGLAGGKIRRTYFSREVIEKAQGLFVAGVPNDAIADLCDVSYGSVSYLLHMEVCVE